MCGTPGPGSPRKRSALYFSGLPSLECGCDDQPWGPCGWAQLMRMRGGKAAGWVEPEGGGETRKIYSVSIKPAISSTFCHMQGLKPVS